MRFRYHLIRRPVASISLGARWVQPKAKFRMANGVEFREWPAWIGFGPAVRKSVLGFGGFLQVFTATFYGDREEVVLEVNALYPGT
jgi:hypothetical protein